jgi:hypothetical protein
VIHQSDKQTIHLEKANIADTESWAEAWAIFLNKQTAFFK